MAGRSRAALATAALVTTVGFAPPALASVPSEATTEQKLTALALLTQPTSSSAAAWRLAYDNQRRYAAFNFDWSTDGCTGAADQLFTFDFRMACRRHDFGYRNYRSLGLFAENKARIDNAFLRDMRQACSRAKTLLRTVTCRSMAWSYYQAVRRFGNLTSGTTTPTTAPSTTR